MKRTKEAIVEFANKHSLKLERLGPNEMPITLKIEKIISNK